MILIIGLWLSFVVMVLLSIGTFIECVTANEFKFWELIVLIGVVIATVIVGIVLFSGGYNLP